MADEPLFLPPAAGSAPVTRFGQALVLTGREVHGRVTDSERAWLQHPSNSVLWLKCLTKIRLTTEAAIAQDRKVLDEQRPMHTSGPTPPEYLALKAAAAAAHRRKLHFLNLVKSRIAQARALISDQGLTPVTAGDVVGLLMTIVGIIDERPADAKRLAESCIRELTEHLDRVAQVDPPGELPRR